MTSPQPDNTGRRPGKRHRIALACTACRTRKSRCDGRRPSCAACKSLAIECQYDPSESSTNILVAKEYVSGLEKRLQTVEGALQRHADLLTGHLSACASTASPSSSERPGDNTIYGATSQDRNLTMCPTPCSDHPGSDEAKTDGLAITYVDEPTSVFYGESSNIAFTRYVVQAISVTSKFRRPGAATSDILTSYVNTISAPLSGQQLHPQSSSSSGQLSPPTSQLPPSTIPPAEEMEALLDAYFTIWGSQFPFIHEPTFREMYNKCKETGFVNVRKTWLGLLNMIFAMTSNVDQRDGSTAKQRLRKSYVFFQRATCLCSEASMQNSSLDTVQYLLLAVFYLLGTERSIQVWTMHGTLVGSATALGLHSDQASRELGPIHQEARRRTWLTICCLDRTLSITFGRPPSIPDEYIPVQTLSPWASTANTPGRLAPSGVDIEADCLGATMRLYQVMGRSISTQYDTHIDRVGSNIGDSYALQTASMRRQELLQWIASLPPYLSLCEPRSQDHLEYNILARLRVILTLRYHFANILIHRPLLCTAIRCLTENGNGAGTSLPYGLQLVIAEAYEGIKSAEKTIQIVHSILCAQEAGSRNLGVWYFTLLNIFISSLVILSHSLLLQYGVFAGHDGDTGGNHVYSTLIKAIEIFDMLDKENHQVQSCARLIRCLAEQQCSQVLLHPTEQQLAQDEGKNTLDDQTWPSLELPTLTGLLADDFDMGQLIPRDLLKPSVDGLGFGLEQGEAFF